MLCLKPYFSSTLSITLLHKWVPPSVIKARGVPNLVKIWLWKNFATTLDHSYELVLLPPILKHSRLPEGCTYG